MRSVNVKVEVEKFDAYGGYTTYHGCQAKRVPYRCMG